MTNDLPQDQPGNAPAPAPPDQPGNAPAPAPPDQPGNVEEYARHNGHADILRERIDGVIGA